MKLKISLFGITKEIVGSPELEVSTAENATVAELQTELARQYPRFAELTSLAVAVNSEYAAPDQLLRPHDEIALIPPVSGG
ncbi:molybdopterin converting factor subunit 1 [Hymenobacter sp. BT175]|uniref:molybdopterin converting factor subunit 1 n=1 Tax=Hymenobacter translucens TaxID=2886507 RepID=UPI001D0DCEE9|nr:molybdopterin converting factor subunit 1 [Hymenobacter translucens]MCC2545558.1 molybdopterin converting factor subunit 1 [Hymenobacter translucens]